MCTKYEVPTSSELRALNYTLGVIDFQNFPNEVNGLNLFWRFSWIWVRISEIFVDLLPSSTACNFFHRCRQPKKVYVFEKYSSRSLHFRCLFGETRNLTLSKNTIKFIEFHKNPESRSAQPHQWKNTKKWKSTSALLKIWKNNPRSDLCQNFTKKH